jgi:hypothetical protein
LKLEKMESILFDYHETWCEQESWNKQRNRKCFPKGSTTNNPHEIFLDDPHKFENLYASN